MVLSQSPQPSPGFGERKQLLGRERSCLDTKQGSLRPGGPMSALLVLDGFTSLSLGFLFLSSGDDEV